MRYNAIRHIGGVDMCFNKRIFTALLILMVCGIHSVAAADYRSDEILVKYKP